MNIITELESYGCGVESKDGQLIVTGGRALPPPIVEKVREAKQDILAALGRDESARSAGFITLVRGEMYERQLNNRSHLFVGINGAGAWECWRETWNALGRVSAYHTVIASGDFATVLERARSYVGYIKLKGAANS